LLVAAQIARRYTSLGLETINITGLMANSRLARSIGDAGWKMLISAIESSMIDHGGILVRHATTYPSIQLCSGYLSDGSKCPGRMKLRLSERTYTCPICDLIIGRDLNAAFNLRPTRGQAEKAIIARVDATTAYNKKISNRAARAASAKKTNAIRIKDKADRRSISTNSDSSAADISAASVDLVTWETLNWSGEGAVNQESSDFPVRRSPDAAILAARSRRTGTAGVLVDQLALMPAEPTG
jgi:hypothetical protein